MEAGGWWSVRCWPNTPEYSSITVTKWGSRRKQHRHISSRHFTGTRPLFFPLLRRRKPSISSFFPIQICRGRVRGWGKAGREDNGAGGRASEIKKINKCEFLDWGEKKSHNMQSSVISAVFCIHLHRFLKGFQRARETVCILQSHLGLFHSHLAFVSVAVETSGDLPHPLTRADTLHKVGRKKSHLVSAFPLANTPNQGHTHTQTFSPLV